jgi:hypothetical protein
MADYAIVPDGTDSEHEFKFLNKEGVAVALAESAKYRILDKDNAVVVAWTPIVPPAPGSIKVPGESNRVREPRDTVRKITIVAKHNGGENLTGEIKYVLANYGGIQTAVDLSD